MPDRAVLELTQNFNGPKEARGFVAEHLTGLAADPCADALLLVSELVTNVVRHGHLPARLTVDVDGDRIHITVHDSNPVLPPAVLAAPSVGALSGRGLVIVAALSRSWGVHTDPAQPGKDVWFEVALTA